MKIGILTFHSAFNFGAILQCHGLYKTLEEMGHDVEVIDYRPNYLFFPRPTLGISSFINRHPLRTYKALPFVFSYRKFYDKFDSFINENWKLSNIATTNVGLTAYLNKYDIIVVGSDQIWNKIHNGDDPIWYGVIPGEHNAKWITYAASAGDALFDSQEKTRFINCIQNFKHISVREEKLNIFLSTLNKDKNIKTVLDPTLLANPNIWKKWYNPILKEKYIVVYQARANDNVFRIASDIAKQKGIDKILVLDNHANVKKNGHKQFIASPSEFISIIRNAECLITTSYHGTAFAIITEIPFYTLYLNDGADERSKNLLSQLNLSNRLIAASHTPKFSSIDYSSIRSKLTELRFSSMEYLYNALL